MPLIKSGSKAALGKNIGELVSSGRPQKQAVAIAYRNARDNGAKLAFGGVPKFKPHVPGPAKSGLIHSAVPGRTDRLPMNVKPNTYIVPADVVSGLGQGNTMAGGKILEAMFTSGPFGTALPKIKKGAGAPRPPSAFRADGGEVGGEGEVPIITAGGEFVVEPEQVLALGGGDYTAGHDLLDQMVKKVRKQVIDDMKKLPGPVK